jgi:hypothetical protein
MTNRIALFLFLAGSYVAFAQNPSALGPQVSNSSPWGQQVTYTAKYQDTTGVNNISLAAFYVAYSLGGTPTCVVSLRSGYFYLDGDTSGLIGPLTPGSGGSISNSQCTLTNPTISTTSTQLTLTMPITPKQSFQGSLAVYEYVADTGGVNSGWVFDGYWVVYDPSDPRPHMSTPTSGSALWATNVTFNWTPQSGADMYSLALGNSAGQWDIGLYYPSTTSFQVTGLPTDGRTLYVSLNSRVNGVWQADLRYTYTAAPADPMPAMVSPPPGSTLPGSNVTFTWTPGVNVTQYALVFGSTPGAWDLGVYWLNATSFTAPNIPTNGHTIYVALQAWINGDWQNFNNNHPSYTYTCAPSDPRPTMISPTNGSTLPGANVTFTWTPGSNVSLYSLTLGSSQGASDMGTFTTSSTSYTLNNMPTDGRTIWAGLSALISGAWQPAINYTYQAYQSSTFDPRRVGIRSTGTYWGAGGEQIDLVSGNLNFTLPLVHPRARGGWTATFALSYNSQMWRQSGGAVSNLGKDLGYGRGWTLQAGAIAPHPSGYGFIYRDQTGAEYYLNQYAYGIYTSQQGTYASYNSNNFTLNFPDGSSWVMSAVSAGGEPDAGTRYPTQMQDTNGNMIQIQYSQGVGGAGTNTSGRITQIMDVRSGGSSFTFTYNNDAPVPHLTAISTSVAANGETYNFGYLPLSQLESPFATTPTFGSAAVLQSVSGANLHGPYTFQYYLSAQPNSPGTDELVQVTTPMGGSLGWSFTAFTYGNGMTYREVNSRTMASGGSLNPWTNTWSVTLHANATVHDSATVADSGAHSSKVWTYLTGLGPTVGLVSSYEERDGSNTALLHKDYTWTQDAAGQVYVYTVTTTLNPGTSSAVHTASAQALDICRVEDGREH